MPPERELGMLELNAMDGKEGVESQKEPCKEQQGEEKYPSPSRLLFTIIALVLSMFLVGKMMRQCIMIHANEAARRPWIW